MAKTERRKNPGPRFLGPVVDILTGINPNTRRAGEARGVLTPDEEGYDFEQLQRAAAWAEVARLGINSKTTRDYLLRSIVKEMRGHGNELPEEPRYLLLCSASAVHPPPFLQRGGCIGLADGDGGVWIAPDLTPAELREHFDWAAKADGGVPTVVFDTAGLQRRLLKKVDERRSREESRP